MVLYLVNIELCSKIIASRILYLDTSFEVSCPAPPVSLSCRMNRIRTHFVRNRPRGFSFVIAFFPRETLTIAISSSAHRVGYARAQKKKKKESVVSGWLVSGTGTGCGSGDTPTRGTTCTGTYASGPRGLAAVVPSCRRSSRIHGPTHHYTVSAGPAFTRTAAAAAVVDASSAGERWCTGDRGSSRDSAEIDCSARVRVIVFGWWVTVAVPRVQFPTISVRACISVHVTR